ncbi:hypothetical protein LTR08_008471 [Meristemomyces frigidus]|nr:hypothetical protein LTR08_008471 [Meristemomyces frigidus]
MATAPYARAGSTAPHDINYDQEVDDFLRDLPLNADGVNNNNANGQPAQDVDEEIKVRKKRNPVPKLDENRLLSDAGVPKLRKIAKTLKFKGKGHEFTDISRLLNTYQLWLDDLYPRAKFRDALGMVEKLGHSKRMQVTRRTWIDATKPSRREDSPERLGDVEMSGALGDRHEDRTREEGIPHGDLFGEHVTQQMEREPRRTDAQHDDIPEDDELDALMAENAPAAQGADSGLKKRQRGPFEEADDELDDDELNTLMAEQAAVVPRVSGKEPQQRKGPFEEEDGGPDEDELDALMAEEPSVQARSKASVTAKAGSRDAVVQGEDDYADEEELMAGIDDMW